MFAAEMRLVYAFDRLAIETRAMTLPVVMTFVPTLMLFKDKTWPITLPPMISEQLITLPVNPP
jgi:hypothetical protein